MRVNNSTTFTRNFNGEAIKPNEVMVPFEYTELEEEYGMALANFDVNSITGYKNQFNEIYKEEAYALLNAIVEMFK